MNSYCWQPYTQMATAPTPTEIVRGEGAYLFTKDGRKILNPLIDN